MLTRPVAAVKFDLSSTPEQAACAMKIDEGLKTFWNVVEHMQHAADRRQPIHQVEETIFRDLLVIGNWLLQAFLDMAGTGDVGPTLRVASDSPSDPDQNLPRLEQPHRRPYLSIFGEVTIERTCYGQDRVEAAPLDAQLHLPQRQYSYLLQQWLGSFVVDDAHAEAIRKLETILGLEITVRASEDLNREQASDVEVFQDRLPVPNAAEEGPLLVVTADCKGVPLVRKALPPEEETDTPLPTLANPRRGKGEKANKKKMAAVGAVYTIEPFVRTADDVIEEVMRKKARKRRPSPQNKRVRAELLVGKVALFLWLADEVIRRNPQGNKPVIFLSDGERALHDRQSEYLPENTVCIFGVLGPGRPGWLPTPAPHRSGLAHHAHPVPHLMNSRPARSVVVTWTWFRSQCTWHVSLQRLMRRHLLLSTGSLGLVPPLQRYSEVLRLPAAHFAALVSFAWRYHRCVRGSSPRPRTRSRGSIGSW